MVEEDGKLFSVIIVAEFRVLAGLLFVVLEGGVDWIADFFAEGLVIFV